MLYNCLLCTLDYMHICAVWYRHPIKKIEMSYQNSLTFKILQCTNFLYVTKFCMQSTYKMLKTVKLITKVM